MPPSLLLMRTAHQLKSLSHTHTLIILITPLRVTVTVVASSVRKPEKLLNCFIKCTKLQLIVSGKMTGESLKKRGPKWSHFSKTVCSLQSSGLSFAFPFPFRFRLLRQLASGYMLMPTRILNLIAYIIYACLLAAVSWLQFASCQLASCSLLPLASSLFCCM